MDGISDSCICKKEFGVKTITDFHTIEQADIVAQSVDVLQIPAFLCRQTDLLVEAAKTDRIINIKKAEDPSTQAIESLFLKKV